MISVQGRIRNRLLRVVDGVLSLVVRSRTAPPRPARPRVLVIRCDYLGDATLATGVLSSLRDALDPSRLDVLCGTWAEPVFRSHAAVDSVIAIEPPWWLVNERASLARRVRAWLRLPRVIMRLRRTKYDIGIDLRGDLRESLFLLWMAATPERISSDRTGGAALLTSVAKHDEDDHSLEQMFAITALAGAKPIGRPALPFPPLSAARRQELGIPENYVAIAPRGASSNREWPAVHVAELARRIVSELGLPSVYVGSARDIEHAKESCSLAGAGLVNTASHTTTEDLFGVIDGAAAVVAMDSGPMHVAAALDRPLVALWGPGMPSMRPLSDQAIVVSSACPCRGPTCQFAEGAGRCYRDLGADQVFGALCRAIAGGSATD